MRKGQFLVPLSDISGAFLLHGNGSLVGFYLIYRPHRPVGWVEV